MTRGRVDSAAASDARQARALAELAQDARLRWRRIDLDLINAAALSATKTLFFLQPREVLLGVVAVPTRRWSGPGVVSVTLEVGTVASPAAFLGPSALSVVPGPAVLYTGPMGMNLLNLETATEIRYRLACNVNLSLINAGAATVHALIVRL